MVRYRLEGQVAPREGTKESLAYLISPSLVFLVPEVSPMHAQLA